MVVSGSADEGAAACADGAPAPCPSLYADVWEFSGVDWQVTHQFNSGLERDCTVASKEPRLHLPAVSLPALQLLRHSLHMPGATTVDGGRLNLFEVHLLLLASMCDAILPSTVNELKFALARRIQARPSSARAERRANSATMWASDGDSDGEAAIFEQPEVGTEAVDISVCSVAGMKETVPRVGVARMDAPIVDHRLSRQVRYVAVLLYPPGLRHMSSNLGEALATSFMDEEFVDSMRHLNTDGPDGLLRAFDKYLSTMTILPTVHLPGDAEDTLELPGSVLPDTLLSDKMVESIEDAICESRGIPKLQHHHHHSHHGPFDQAADHLGGGGASFFVEVDEIQGSESWHMTHRLRQGLELDSAKKSSGVHLPRVSVAALAQLRQMLTSSTVALDIAAECAVSAVNVAMDMLRRSHLPQAANDELARALVDRAVGAGVGNIRTSGTADGLGEVIKPVQNDEACHVLAITSRHIPPTTAMRGAFLRFKSPLNFSFPSTEAPVRFLVVFIGPEQAKLSTLADSVAALAVDEDLMGELNRAGAVSDFIEAFDRRLSSLQVIPHARLRQDTKSRSRLSDGSKAPELSLDIDPDHDVGYDLDVPWWWRKVVSIIQTWQVPLVSGVLLALIWSNVDSTSYAAVVDGKLFGDNATVFGHPLTLHFIVNDIFMCFFFGLAIKEVTEALLPGGSLSPLRNAVNPLMATIGGVVGPAVAYLAIVGVMWATGSFDGWMCYPADYAASSAHRLRRLGGAVPPAEASVDMEPCGLPMLIRGWGIPCATDISLAWMFALLIFGLGHPAIDFLLLLAIVDDAIGMVIIATYYSDPANPVAPQWLLLNLAAIVVAAAMRKLGVSVWWGYVFCAGPISWVGLLKAHVHPALSLAFVVPFIPAHAEREALGQGPAKEEEEEETPQTSDKNRTTNRLQLISTSTKAQLLHVFHSYHEAPLHVFERTLKFPVDCGMFFFGMCNAGVALSNVGHVTTAVLGALIVGKTCGIAFFSLAAVAMGFDLVDGLTVSALFAMSALGGVGLTVALFVANEAFVDPGLVGQAKFAAVLSVSSAGVALLLSMAGNSRLCGRRAQIAPDKGVEESGAQKAASIEEDKPEYLDELLVNEVRRILWLQRRYSARGIAMHPLELARTPQSRSASKMKPAAGQIPIEAIESVVTDLDLDLATPSNRSRPGSRNGPPSGRRRTPTRQARQIDFFT